MEASEQQTEPQVTEAPSEGDGGLDLGPLMERFDSLGSDISDFREQVGQRLEPLEQLYADREPEPQQQPNPFEGLNPDDLYTDPGQFMGRMQEVVQQQIQQGIQEGLQQGLQPFVEERVDRELAELEKQYPDLSKDGTAYKETAVETMRLMESWNVPEQFVPAVARLVYEAQMGRERAQQETPAGDQQETVQLEQGGATPAEPEQDNVFQRLWEKEQGNRSLWS